jgi:hypothetical protein
MRLRSRRKVLSQLSAQREYVAINGMPVDASQAGFDFRLDASGSRWLFERRTPADLASRRPDCPCPWALTSPSSIHLRCRDRRASPLQADAESNWKALALQIN